jgi:hypothetical protein
MDITRGSTNKLFRVSLQSFIASFLKTEITSASECVIPTELDDSVISDIESPLRESETASTCPDLYASVVAKLVYIGKTARPDIAYVATALSRHTYGTPAERHWAAAVKVMLYLYGSMDCNILLGCNASAMRGTGTGTGIDVPSLRAYFDATQLDNGHVRVGYMVSMEMSPIAWGSFIDTRKTHSQADAQLVAADAAYKSMKSLHKLLVETNTLENLFPNNYKLDMAIASHDADFRRVICGRSPFSLNKGIDTAISRIRFDPMFSRLVIDAPDADSNCASIFCRLIDGLSYCRLRQMVMTGDVSVPFGME